MSGPVTGAVLGLTFGAGAWLVVDQAWGVRRRLLAVRVLPYLRDLPQARQLPASLRVEGTAARRPWQPLLGWLARAVERVLGGADAVSRRLDRLGSPMTVHDFRVEQAVWGLVAFAMAAVPCSLIALRHPERGVPLLLCCLCVGAAAVLLRENRLTSDVVRRERRMLEEFPAIAALLALAVAAGEGPVAALERVCGRAQGELAAELRRVLAAVHTGTPVARAFDDLAGRTGLAVMARFAEAIAIAVERGTPLSDVLHHQAADVREAGRRALIETGARREVLMMVPVVFLVLPVVVVFAFYPGLIGLRLVV
jgi:tight adherence protein C